MVIGSIGESRSKTSKCATAGSTATGGSVQTQKGPFDEGLWVVGAYWDEPVTSCVSMNFGRFRGCRSERVYAGQGPFFWLLPLTLFDAVSRPFAGFLLDFLSVHERAWASVEPICE